MVSEEVVGSGANYEYKFDCTACARQQTLSRSTPIVKTEKIYHICEHCGDRGIIILGADGSVDGFDEGTVVG